MKKKLLHIGTAILLTLAIHSLFTLAGGVMSVYADEESCDPIDNENDNDNDNDNYGAEA